MAVVAAAAGITVIMTAGGPQRPQASALGLGEGSGRRVVQRDPGRTSGATPGRTTHQGHAHG